MDAEPQPCHCSDLHVVRHAACDVLLLRGAKNCSPVATAGTVVAQSATGCQFGSDRAGTWSSARLEPSYQGTAAGLAAELSRGSSGDGPADWNPDCRDGQECLAAGGGADPGGIFSQGWPVLQPSLDVIGASSAEARAAARSAGGSPPDAGSFYSRPVDLGGLDVRRLHRLHGNDAR